MKGSSSGMTASALFYMAPARVIFHRGMRTRGDLVLSLCETSLWPDVPGTKVLGPLTTCPVLLQPPQLGLQAEDSSSTGQQVGRVFPSESHGTTDGTC